MTTGDIIGVTAVYLYVIILLITTEKLIVKNQLLSRKVLHIGVGNILFLLPIFDSRYVITFFAAAPFIVLTYLISPYSPIDVVSRTSTKGHKLGLVYYAISWTILAFVFFDNPVIIAIGIAAMSHGDGFASLMGIKYGKVKYNIFGDVKSIEGSITMFLFTSLVSLIAIMYYQAYPPYFLLVVPIVAFIATIAEGVTPKGLDNIGASLSAAFSYYILVFIIL
ncbi:MAG: diacylglycerol/polyprenol kinase family protein [Thermoplasmatota archaeon]